MSSVDAIWLFSVLMYPATSWLPTFLPAALPPSHPLSHSIEMLVVLATAVRNYLKWWAIQLAIHSTVGV